MSYIYNPRRNIMNALDIEQLKATFISETTTHINIILKLKFLIQFVKLLGFLPLSGVWVCMCLIYEAVSGLGPGFDLFKDKNPSAFLEMTYPNILGPKFS